MITFGIGQCAKWGTNLLNPVEDCCSQCSITHYPQLVYPCRCWVAVWQPRQQLVCNISTCVPVALAYQLDSWRDDSCLSCDGAWLIVVEIWKLKSQVLHAQLSIPCLVQSQVSLFFLTCYIWKGGVETAGMASPRAFVGVVCCPRQQRCLAWYFFPLTQQWPGLLHSMQVHALVVVAVWKGGGLQGLVSLKPGWSCVTLRCGWMLMYRSEVVRRQFGGCFSLALLWCQRVSAVVIVHT